VPNNEDIIRIGQFSESAVLAVARALGLDQRFGIGWVTERVPSSPAQFDSLRKGEMDIAITSPDNVLLYATTSENPLGEQLDLHFLRPIDRGLGLALYTDSSISSAEDFAGATLGVDVMSSGFALLLLSMLDHLGVDKDSVKFEAVGATPKRLEAIRDGSIQGSVLNAEAAVNAEKEGFTRWATSRDISDRYVGTVLAQMGHHVTPRIELFLEMWEEATRAIVELETQDVLDLLNAQAPALANPDYVALLRSTDFGCLTDHHVATEDLEVLSQIRSSAGAYRPSPSAIETLATD
jgi:ABC-type nitrate/sulfonate/bicarbonate transport system substrate-binding protein